MTDNSHIEIADGHTAFVGHDATRLFAAASLRSAIKLYIKTGMRASRAYTPSNMLRAATRITGKAYKRSQLAKAAEDLDLWIAAMHAAMPVVDKRS